MMLAADQMLFAGGSCTTTAAFAGTTAAVGVGAAVAVLCGVVAFRLFLLDLLGGEKAYLMLPDELAAPAPGDMNEDLLLKFREVSSMPVMS